LNHGKLKFGISSYAHMKKQNSLTQQNKKMPKK